MISRTTTMTMRRGTIAIGGMIAAFLMAGCQQPEEPQVTTETAGDTMEVKLCDDETSTTVEAGVERTADDGAKIAASLMDQWKRKNPNRNWVEEEQEKHMIVPPADNSHLIGKSQGHTYARITEQDAAMWQRETINFVTEGSRIFHSADELGSDIAVSCDMCHPDASNTHPETYPKFQEQLGKVVLLRDMINWCIEHPVRGDKLEPDSPKMRALEAYTYAQRKGEALNYGLR